MAAEAKATMEAKKQAGMKMIVNLEQKIDEDNSNDVTPKPKATYKLHPLRRMSSHLFIPLNNSAPDFSEPVTEQTSTEDEYQQPTERETDTDIEFEEDLAPPKKKEKGEGSG